MSEHLLGRMVSVKFNNSKTVQGVLLGADSNFIVLGAQRKDKTEIQAYNIVTIYSIFVTED